MSGFSDYLENNILNMIFGKVNYSIPDIVYIGLSQTSISDDVSNITEPIGKGYSRIAIANNSTNFPLTSTSLKTNGIDIFFPTATHPWEVIIDFFISDSLTGGNMLCNGVLDVSKYVSAGDTLKFGIGTLKIKLIKLV